MADERRSLGQNYTFIRTLGEGSFGVTLLASQNNVPGQRVAIKKPRDIPGAAVMLQEEADMLCSLRHARIVPFIEYVKTGRGYLVMEYVPSGDLSQRLGGIGLTSAEKRRVFIHIIEALDYIHLKGVIHLDIK